MVLTKDIKCGSQTVLLTFQRVLPEAVHAKQYILK